MRKAGQIAVLALVLLLSGCGISGNLRHHAGYAAFDSPRGWDADRVMAVSLGPLPLRLARAFVDEAEEDLEILRALDAVRVYVYEIEGDPAGIARGLDLTARNLEAAGWSPMVAVREDDGFVRVLVTMNDSHGIDGMVVMVTDPREVVLVNLMGDIRPEHLGQYLEGLDLGVPGVKVGEPG